MTLFNDPIRVKGGRVISLWPTARMPSRKQEYTGPRRTWALAYPARSTATPVRPR